jgi:hypothetical protein
MSHNVVKSTGDQAKLKYATYLKFELNSNRWQHLKPIVIKKSTIKKSSFLFRNRFRIL